MIDMGDMFYGATSFEHPLDSGNVTSVTKMASMFHGANSFNLPLDSGTC